MRRRIVFALLVGLSIAGGFIACGLDEHGEASDGGIDATIDAPSDVVIDAPIDVPQACKTLDATACSDADLPDGWTYTVVTRNSICPTTVDYQMNTYLTELAPSGGCTCGCTTSGKVDCSGTLEAGSGSNCDDSSKWFLFDAGNDAACVTTNWGDPHYGVPGPPSSATGVTCDASVLTPSGWDASAVTTCTPQCTADYCAVGNTFKRCIISNGDQACIAPFTQKQLPIGVDAGITTSCTGCGCGINPIAQCTATIQPFSDPSCATAIDAASPANGTCYDTKVGGAPGQVKSFFYNPTVPTATCSPSAITGTASAQFASTVTVCCLP